MTIVRRLSPTGDMMFGQGLGNFASATEACAQNVRTRLLMLRGEWFLNLDAGVPYLDEVFVSPVQLALAEAAIKQAILDTIDVSQILAFSLVLDHNTRLLTVTATVGTIYDETTSITVTT